MKIPLINQRVQQLIDYYANGVVTRFAELLPTISQQRLNRLFNIDSRTGKYPVVTTDILIEITKVFVDVSAEWLLTGRGEMFYVAPKDNVDRVAQYPKNKNAGVFASDISTGYNVAEENNKYNETEGRKNEPRQIEERGNNREYMDYDKRLKQLEIDISQLKVLINKFLKEK